MIRYSSRTALSSIWPCATREGRILNLLFLTLYLLHRERIGGIRGHVYALKSYYSNVTLNANDGDLSVVIYLPPNVKTDERAYYQSSRFDWGSMIGNIVRSSTNPNTGVKESHVLYGINQWRLPHDPYWAESGVGLASEFGVGTDGSFCNFMCGWDQVNEVTNGILGYTKARSGESFLKIGVGELIKGSCNSCDSAEDYKFNSPYQFAKSPVWTLQTDQIDNSNTIVLSHQAVLDDRPYGYKVERHITLNDDQLLVKTFLSNLGSQAFSTAWYSSHLFSCDAHPVAYGYSLDLDLASSGGAYDEPTTWSWSTPLADYAKVYMHNNTDHGGGRVRHSKHNDDDGTRTSVRVDIQQGIEAYVQINALFSKAEQSKGEFTVRGCNTKIRESIPEVGDATSGISMYAYNLYVESGSLSPEPQILLHLEPGQTTSWTQQLDFSDNYPEETRSPQKPAAPLGKLVLDQSSSSSEANEESSKRSRGATGILPAFVIVVAVVSLVYQAIVPPPIRTRRKNREQYHRVPDAAIDDYPKHTDNTENDAI